jgi:hypothetical protein
MGLNARNRPLTWTDTDPQRKISKRSLSEVMEIISRTLWSTATES